MRGAGASVGLWCVICVIGGEHPSSNKFGPIALMVVDIGRDGVVTAAGSTVASFCGLLRLGGGGR